jgi:Fe-S cluster assembly scaffold protein SufB
MFIRGSQQRLGLRTRFVLVDGAFFTGRHFVAATALGASGTAESSLDVLRATEGVVATVVPEVGAMPVGLTVQHGARVLGVAEAQQEYLQAHGVLPSVAQQTLIDAFFYA